MEVAVRRRNMEIQVYVCVPVYICVAQIQRIEVCHS